MRRLEGRTAVVTGAASGIGLGLAGTFARSGRSVVLCRSWLEQRHRRILDAYAECERWEAERKAAGEPQ